MSADTTCIILKTGRDIPEWRVAVVQGAEDLFDFTATVEQIEAGRSYAGELSPGEVDDETARLMASKAAHVAAAYSADSVAAPGKLNRAFLLEYFRDAQVFGSRETALNYAAQMEDALVKSGGHLEYGKVEYSTDETFPTHLND